MAEVVTDVVQHYHGLVSAGRLFATDTPMARKFQCGHKVDTHVCTCGLSLATLHDFCNADTATHLSTLVNTLSMHMVLSTDRSMTACQGLCYVCLQYCWASCKQPQPISKSNKLCWLQPSGTQGSDRACRCFCSSTGSGAANHNTALHVQRQHCMTAA